MSESNSSVNRDSAETRYNRELYQNIADMMVDWLDDDSSGHDADHAWRVFNLGTRIAKEENADAEIVGAAALTHDIHRIMGSSDEYVEPAESLPEVRSILESTGFPEEKIPQVLHCVEVHDEYKYRGVDRPAESIEAEVLRDADNLDAIGAVGVARTIAFTAVAGYPLWAPDRDEHSAIQHYYDKLQYLEDEMNTDQGRRLAEERHQFTKTFVDQVTKEWYGEL